MSSALFSGFYGNTLASSYSSLLSKRPIFKCNYQYIIADGLCNWGEYALALVGITRRDEVDGKVHLFNVNLTNDTVPEHIHMVVMLVIAA